MKASSLIFRQAEPLQIFALSWVLIRFIATVIGVRVRADIRVKNFRVKAT